MLDILNELKTEMISTDIIYGKWSEYNDNYHVYHSTISDVICAVTITTDDPEVTYARTLLFEKNSIIYKIYTSGVVADNGDIKLGEPLDINIDMLNLSEEEFFQRSVIDNFADMDYDTYKAIVSLYFILYDKRVEHDKRTKS